MISLHKYQYICDGLDHVDDAYRKKWFVERDEDCRSIRK